MKIFINLITFMPFEDLKFFSIYEAINTLKDHKILTEFVSPSVSSIIIIKEIFNIKLRMYINYF